MRRTILAFAFVVCSTAIVFKAWSYRSIAIEAQQQLEATDQITPKIAAYIVIGDAGLSLIGDVEPRAAADAIRDYVYRNFDPGKEELPDKSAPAYYASLSSTRNGMLCGGAGLAYAWALNTVGIPARVVQLAGQDFLSGKDRYQTHVTVEALIDGDWEISDPTFNVSIQCSRGNGKNLSVDGVLACLRQGRELEYSPGKTQIDGRKIDPKEYPVYFAAFVRRALSENGVDEPEASFPSDDWLKTALSTYEE